MCPSYGWTILHLLLFSLSLFFTSSSCMCVRCCSLFHLSSLSCVCVCCSSLLLLLFLSLFLVRVFLCCWVRVSLFVFTANKDSDPDTLYIVVKEIIKYRISSCHFRKIRLRPLKTNDRKRKNTCVFFSIGK